MQDIEEEIITEANKESVEGTDLIDEDRRSDVLRINNEDNDDDVEDEDVSNVMEKTEEINIEEIEDLPEEYKEYIVYDGTEREFQAKKPGKVEQTKETVDFEIP